MSDLAIVITNEIDEIIISDVAVPVGAGRPASDTTDIEVTDYTKGIILRTLTGQRVRITIDENITTNELSLVITPL